MRKILYIGRVELPNDAASIRVYNNSRLFHSLGYDVEVLCLRHSLNNDQNEIEYESWLKYYFAYKKQRSSVLNSIRNILELLTGLFTYRIIKQRINKSKPEVIVLYNDLFVLSILLNVYCRKNGIKLVADVTEWYEKKDRKKSCADYFVPYLTDKRIRFVDKKIGNIMAISPYLFVFYAEKGCNVLMMPPLFECKPQVEIKKYNYYNHYVINFIYAGSPGNKDILSPFIDALTIINQSRVKVRLDIIGIDYSRLEASIKMDNEMFRKIGVFAHDKVPHSEVEKYVQKADFGLLLRHDKRYAKAGFSTKFVECMCNGVAMFANLVGGAEALLKNGDNGFVIENCTVECIVSKLNYIMALDVSDILRIRRNAYNYAAKNFNMDIYREPMEIFITEGAK